MKKIIKLKIYFIILLKILYNFNNNFIPEFLTNLHISLIYLLLNII